MNNILDEYSSNTKKIILWRDDYVFIFVKK